MARSSRTITSVEDWVLRRPLDPYGSLGRLYPVTHACVGGRIACGLDFRGWPQQRQDVPWPNPVHGRAWRCPNCVRAVRIGRRARGRPAAQQACEALAGVNDLKAFEARMLADVH